MRLLKLTAILSLWVVFFAVVGLVHLWVSLLGRTQRWKIISRINRCSVQLLRTLLNIKVTVEGDPAALERGGCLIIANHMGYLDGIVLGSIFPLVFVTKKEVRRWPVVGLWNILCGSIFVDRQHKGQVGVLVDEMAGKLRQDANILLFPEGTSTDGERLLPFQTVPLAAPLRCRSIIVPATLVYRSIEERPVNSANRDLIYWYGDMDFISHFWKLLALGSVEVLVTIQPKIECFRYPDTSDGRKKLAEDCYNRVLGRRVENRTESVDDGDEEGEAPLPH